MPNRLTHSNNTQNPIWILAPFGRDSLGASRLFDQYEIPYIISESMHHLCENLNHTVGTLLITEEAFIHDNLELLTKRLNQQPPWSDIPIILLTKNGENIDKTKPSRSYRFVEALNNVIILERPLHMLTLLSIVRTALKARTRQFLTRDYLTEKDKVTESLRESEAQFRSLAESIPQLIWASSSTGYSYYFNTRWSEYTGLTAEESYGSGWMNALHPEDVIRTQTAWKNALNTGEFYEVEYRLKGSTGQYRWFLALGRPIRKDTDKTLQWMGTCTDISDHKEWEKELKDLKESAETANHRKSQFLATMSHELRTPLNAIIGYSKMLQSEMSGPLNAKQEKYTSHIYASGNHLLEMITELLDHSKIEAGKLRLYPETIEIPGLVQEVIDIVSDLAQNRNVHIFKKISREVNLVYADASRLRQVFFNLLSNAIKFNRNNGTVTIRLFIAETSPNFLTCEIEDTGIGIPQDKLNLLFTEFYQVDNSYSRKQEGTGLGLAITKQLVELQGGSVKVESKADVGSKFIFTVPLEA